MACAFHDDAIKWMLFPHYGPYVCGIHRSPGVFPAQSASNVDFVDFGPYKQLNKQLNYQWFENT